VNTCENKVFYFLLGDFIMSAKSKMLSALKQTSGYNTFSVKQAQRRFGITNVTARIDELRQEGHVIYTNTKSVEGKKVSFYRLGTPTKAMVQAALSAGYSFNQ
jgi:hypothetical protein